MSIAAALILSAPFPRPNLEPNLEPSLGLAQGMRPTGAALRLEIEAPKEVRAHERFMVKTYLKNTSDRPIILLRPELPNGPFGFLYDSDLWLSGKRIPSKFSGMQYGQYGVRFELILRDLITLKPDQRYLVDTVEYGQRYASGKRPGLISEIAKAPVEDLPPGRYDLFTKVRYERRTAYDSPSGKQALTATNEAKPLWEESWTGSLTDHRPITILKAR